MNNPDIDVNPNIPPNAVSVIGDTTDDFPVLKAFQQYIDAEQNKARKRMISLCIFFGCLMTAVILVFLFLLNGVSQRNEALNDRLLDYMMKKETSQASVVVQHPSDNSAMLGLTAKLNEIQKKLSEAESAEQARKEAAEKAVEEKLAAEAASRKALEKARIKEKLEIERLKEELAEERERASLEREKKRLEEIEAYRRKYYPEYYKKQTPSKSTISEKSELDELLEEIDKEGPVNYFEEDDEEDRPLSSSKGKKTTRPNSYSIPVEVKGVKAKWRIPNT